MSFSAEQILQAARADPHYLGNANAQLLVSWAPAPDAQSELLVSSPAPSDDAEAAPTTSDNIELAVLKMIVQLRPSGFYLTPDAHFNPDRPAPWQAGRSPITNLSEGHGSVVLGPVPESISVALHSEWLSYKRATDAIMRAVLPCVSKSGFLVTENSKTLYKLTHQWWEKRCAHEVVLMMSGSNPGSKDDGNHNDHDDADNGHEGFDFSQINLEELDSDREPAFRTINVPVHQDNHPVLLELARTHSFNPLCVYRCGNRNAPLRPTEYATVLPGAIALVTFTLAHKIIKRPKAVSHFTATIDEIEVLKRPAKVNLSPSKAANKALFRKRGPSDAEAGPSAKCARNA